MNLDKWRSQLRKGLLEYGLLGLIRSQKSLYGLEIIEALNREGIPITEGTMYPLLNRLTREKVLKSKWYTENVSGHPRKYYELSATGEKMFESMDVEWTEMITSIKNLINPS